jgi:predicted NBD/HSP70 family sugar kinase
VLSAAPSLDGALVLKAASEHDLLARLIVEEAFEMVGVAIAAVISITNPRVLVLDGTLAAAGDEIRDHLLRVIRRSALPDHWSTLEILFSQSDASIGSAGGAVDLIDSLLEY